VKKLRLPCLKQEVARAKLNKVDVLFGAYTIVRTDLLSVAESLGMKVYRRQATFPYLSALGCRRKASVIDDSAGRGNIWVLLSYFVLCRVVIDCRGNHKSILTNLTHERTNGSRSFLYLGGTPRSHEDL
jgi:hypothetical protein